MDPWLHGLMSHRLKALTPMGPKGPRGRGPIRCEAHGLMGACAPAPPDPRAYRFRDPYAHELCARAQMSTNQCVPGPSSRASEGKHSADRCWARDWGWCGRGALLAGGWCSGSGRCFCVLWETEDALGRALCRNSGSKEHAAVQYRQSWEMQGAPPVWASSVISIRQESKHVYFTNHPLP